MLEVAAQDPKQGTIFYTLSQPEVTADEKPLFVRDEGNA